MGISRKPTYNIQTPSTLSNSNQTSIYDSNPPPELLMEEELLKLKVSPSFKRRFDSSISRSDSEQDLPRYTSLKDIISSTSPQHATGSNEYWRHSFSHSNISIRNELVKHAASAYVQSAAVLVNRDQDWAGTLGERLKTGCVGFCSCLRIRVLIPLEALYSPVFGALSRVFCVIRNGVCGRVGIT